MTPRSEGSSLKRPRVPSSGTPAEAESFKKPRTGSPRRSERLSHKDDLKKTPVSQRQQLPSPLTCEQEESGELLKEATATPPEGRQTIPHRQADSQIQSSPLQETQAFSQQIDPNKPLSDEVEDEVKEGVWGYLIPYDPKYGGPCVVLRKRAACPMSDTVSEAVSTKKKGRKLSTPLEDEESFNESRIRGVPSGGYLIGRHPECDVVVDDPIVSNRHCLLFTEHSGNETVVILEDLSSNGTFVNEAIVGRNQRRELRDGDEVAVLDKARFVFKYPRTRSTSAFLQQYTLMDKLGKGHFAEVYLCVEKSTGSRYAVKIFTKTPGIEDRSKNEGLQQEIAVLMGVAHPNVLCLKESFNESNAVYLVLELAPKGELFNYIVAKQKLTESECRKLFTQLFQGVKYLHDRNIVHRDIKPENILLVDTDLHVKIADFGLAKIIGEESFTTTLCGTPSYVAPEILSDTRHRKYTKAVDVWSLGVVLYICLCGFPPFSDELYSRQFPLNLSQQIKAGRFDYPSPYWDSVGDPALDLIDSMLVVDPEKRFTIDQCLQHPWMKLETLNPNDSTNGLVNGLAELEVQRRAPHRERTLLSSLNTVQVANRVPMSKNQPDVKIHVKNPKGPKKEIGPADGRDPREFMALGGKGDQELFGHDGESFYSKDDVAKQGKKAAR